MEKEAAMKCSRTSPPYALVLMMAISSVLLGAAPVEGLVTCGKSDIFAGSDYTVATIPGSCTRITLEDSAIGDDGAAALADALKANTRVTELFLARSNIGDVGAIALAAALKENNVVRDIHFFENTIGDNGAVALADMLKVNTGIEHMSFSSIYYEMWEVREDSIFGNIGGAAFAEALKVNSVVTDLNGARPQWAWTNVDDSTIIASIEASLAANQNPTCADSKRNGDEVGIDCGGVACNACPDACHDGTDTCDSNADCSITAGGHACNCKVGFNGDGTSCTPPPPAATPPPATPAPATPPPAHAPCPEGQGNDGGGDHTKDTECVPCDATSTYSDSSSTAEACKAVKQCSAGEQEDQAPTTSSDRTCKDCDTGTYATSGANTCTTHTSCGEQTDGTTRLLTGASTTAAGSCEACDQGTYAGSATADCASWTNANAGSCADGSVWTTGSSTVDSSCGAITCVAVRVNSGLTTYVLGVDTSTSPNNCVNLKHELNQIIEQCDGNGPKMSCLHSAALQDDAYQPSLVIDPINTDMLRFGDSYGNTNCNAGATILNNVIEDVTPYAASDFGTVGCTGFNRLNADGSYVTQSGFLQDSTTKCAGTAAALTQAIRLWQSGSYTCTSIDCVLGAAVGANDCTAACGTVYQSITSSATGAGTCTPQSYVCQPDDGECTRIGWCDANCDQEHGECVNTGELFGTYGPPEDGQQFCGCKSGYELSQRASDSYAACIDINECNDAQYGLHRTPCEQIEYDSYWIDDWIDDRQILTGCINTDGGYTCEYETAGYTYTTLFPERVCTESDGWNPSVDCVCNEGWEENGARWSKCIDYDECDDVKKLGLDSFLKKNLAREDGANGMDCDQENGGTCTNTVGSYICGCKSGYEGSWDDRRHKFTCIAIKDGVAMMAIATPATPATLQLEIDLGDVDFSSASAQELEAAKEAAIATASKAGGFDASTVDKIVFTQNGKVVTSNRRRRAAANGPVTVTIIFNLDADVDLPAAFASLNEAIVDGSVSVGITVGGETFAGTVTEAATKTEAKEATYKPGLPVTPPASASTAGVATGIISMLAAVTTLLV